MSLLSKTKLLFINKGIPIPRGSDANFLFGSIVTIWYYLGFLFSFTYCCTIDSMFDLAKNVWGILITQFAEGDYFRLLIYMNKSMFLDKGLTLSQTTSHG